MAVRIRNFGGVLQELAPGASLERNDLRLVFCRTASRLAYLLYVTRGLLRRNWKIPGIDLAHSGRVSCQYLPAPAFHRWYARHTEGLCRGGRRTGGHAARRNHRGAGRADIAWRLPARCTRCWQLPAQPNRILRPLGTRHPFSDRRMPGPRRTQPQDGAGHADADARRRSSRPRRPQPLRRSGLRLRPSSRLHPFFPRSSARRRRSSRLRLSDLAFARTQGERSQPPAALGTCSSSTPALPGSATFFSTSPTTTACARSGRFPKNGIPGTSSSSSSPSCSASCSWD